ncbi:MAG: methyltransferase [Alphaproteobacteria bacterium]|nr:methyltransferase [Alphaproteobacteria bacterium]
MRHRHRRKSRSAPPRPADPIELTIDRIGARGDGIAAGLDGPIYVPGTVPGDRVEAIPGPSRGDGRAATLKALLQAGPGRVEPVCRHAAHCGGCTLQHASDALIADLKRDQLVEALARKNLPVDCVEPTRTVPPGARRRLRLTALRLSGRTVLGFNERASSKVIDVQECPVARPELTGLLPALRDLVGGLGSLGRGADLQLTLSDTGIEILLVPAAGGDPSLDERQTLVEFAELHDIARIGWETEGIAEPLAARRTPRTVFAGVPVDLPIGGFLQPSREGQDILTDLVLSGVPEGADSVADLYAGCGSFSIPLSRRGANVVAVEGSEPAVAALRRGAAGLRLQAECRDLARNPLSAAELNRFQAVVFDPPRAGAAPQAEMLAASDVATIVAVSCNPATLARDLRSLVDGGYTLTNAVPVDQFTWSGHVEAVAVLSRDA